MNRAIIICLFLCTAAVGQDAPFGQQVSETGIKHSFLVTGSMTAIIDEDNKIIWQAKGRSRDGFVLENGNILISHQKAAREYTREGKVVFEYKLDPANKELGTSVRLKDGSTMIVERGPKPRLVEVTPKGKIVKEIPLQPDSNNAHMQTPSSLAAPAKYPARPHQSASRTGGE